MGVEVPRQMPGMLHMHEVLSKETSEYGGANPLAGPLFAPKNDRGAGSVRWVLYCVVHPADDFLIVIFIPASDDFSYMR